MTDKLSRGTVLNGKYVVRNLIGMGSVGNVYVCSDLDNGIDVAVKEMKTYNNGLDENKCCSDDNNVKSMKVEIDVLTRLGEDPDFPDIYDVFEENETLYIAMEHIKGETLESLLRRGVIFTEEEIRTIGVSVLRPLKRMHSMGVLHCDICPMNIIIGERVRLLDFGSSELSLSVDGRFKSFRSGFSAPEQYDSIGVMGPWTDLYELGAVLYVLAFGQRLPDARIRLEKENVNLPDRHNRSVSNELIRVIMKSVSLNPKDRYQTCEQFEKAIIRTIRPEKNKIGNIITGLVATVVLLFIALMMLLK